jgi:hypothetical protein
MEDDESLAALYERSCSDALLASAEDDDGDDAFWQAAALQAEGLEAHAQGAHDMDCT